MILGWRWAIRENGSPRLALSVTPVLSPDSPVTAFCHSQPENFRKLRM